MLKVYGSMLCPDCVQCRADLDAADVTYQYFDFAEDLRSLKVFLSLRDSDPIFHEVKAEGRIGIPCIVDEQGSVTLDWSCYVGQD